MIISALKLLSILQSDVKTMGMMLELLVIKVAKLTGLVIAGLDTARCGAEARMVLAGDYSLDWAEIVTVMVTG